MEKKKEYIGIILSESSTKQASCQLFESAERGGIREGMLLLVETGGRNLLARVAEIIPYNAFYTEGDPWSEARRKGLPIPEEVARRYEVCKLDLLIEIGKGGKPSEIKYPPQPGDKVLKLDPKLHEKEIYGVRKGDPKHIWYGSLAGYADAPIPLNVENIPMHMAIFGVTGSGKSFDAGALIEKLAKIPVKKGVSVSYPMIVIDAHGDYVDYVDHVAKGNDLGAVGWIKRFVFPKAYSQPKFRKQKLIQPIGINLNLIPIRELAEIIVLYYKGTTEGAELQISGISSLIDRMLISEYEQQEIFEEKETFNELLNELDDLAKETKMHDATKKAISRALESFREVEEEHRLLSTRSPLKEEKFVDDITRNGGIAIIDFSADAAPGVDLKTKQFVMTYLASLLFDKFTKFKMNGEERYLLFMIEEAQNFCPDKSFPVSSSLAHSKLSAIATQGRKFGLSLCLISQRPSFVDRIVLSMCNTFFIHRISPEDVGFVKSVTGGLPPSLARRLTTLNTGEIIVTGQMNTVPFPLDIQVTDREVPPTIGKTRVVENLAKLRNVL